MAAFGAAAIHSHRYQPKSCQYHPNLGMWSLVTILVPIMVMADISVEWTDVARSPFATGETSAGILQAANGEPLLVVMGFNPDDQAASQSTQVLNINANRWSVKAPRPYIGHHMAAATVRNKLYLIGGYLDLCPGNMQIYDPLTDTWTVGPKPLFQSGAAAAVAIGDTIYYCGGVRGGIQEPNSPPIRNCAKFNVATNTWSTMAAMPYAVHHASMATDGYKVYQFAGRNSSGGTGKNPVNYTMVYNPKTNIWVSSSQPGGPAPTPVGRGGMGAAVYYKDYFYIMGGEVKCSQTWMGPCPNNKLNLSDLGVFNRIDRYNPRTNTWDRGLPGMSVGRHGQFPVVGPAPNAPANAPSVVWSCAGGIKQGYDEDTLCTYMSV